MKILFFNYDVGANVERTGNINIEIFRRIKGIEKIFVWKSQCQNKHKTDLIEFVKNNAFDIIISEDSYFRNDLFLEYLKNRPVFIQFIHGGSPHEIFDVIFCLSKPAYSKLWKNNFVELNPYIGNIWKIKKNFNDRVKGFLYVGRIQKSKFEPREFYFRYFKDFGGLKAFGYFDEFSFTHEERQILNQILSYSGAANPKKLVNIYNSYTMLYFYSTSECIANSVREAIMCGCVPVVNREIKKQLIDLSNFMIFHDEFDFEKVKEKFFEIKENYDYIKQKHSMEENIIKIISTLRAVFLKDFKWSKEPIADVELIGPGRQKEQPIYYHESSVDFEKLRLE